MVVIQAHKDSGTQLRYMVYCRGTRIAEQLAAAQHTQRDINSQLGHAEAITESNCNSV